MAITLSELDAEAMETIIVTIDQIMALDDYAYIAASEKVLTIVRKYLDGLLMQINVSGKNLFAIPEGGSA